MSKEIQSIRAMTEKMKSLVAKKMTPTARVIDEFYKKNPNATSDDAIKYMKALRHKT